jgi:hypothetical protein
MKVTFNMDRYKELLEKESRLNKKNNSFNNFTKSIAHYNNICEL